MGVDQTAIPASVEGGIGGLPGGANAIDEGCGVIDYVNLRIASSTWGGLHPSAQSALALSVFVKYVVVFVLFHILLLSYLLLPPPLFCFSIFLLSVQSVFGEFVVLLADFGGHLCPGAPTRMSPTTGTCGLAW